MKNEVNRTFTVKKNKFTNFLSCFCANTPQNLGGGNSHSSTVVTPVWKGSRPTVNRRSTDSQSQDHRNHTPISKALKYAAMILMILTLGIGNAWGADYVITLDQFRTNPISGLVNITGLTIESGAFKLSSGNADFVVSSRNSDYKIKKIVFTTQKANISYGGNTITENTFTPETPNTSFTLNLAASGGTAKITQMEITLTTSTSETLEDLEAAALTDGVYTAGSSVVTVSTEGGDVDTSKKLFKLSKSKNTRSLTIATSSSYTLKFVTIYYYDAIFSRTITASTGSYTTSTYTWNPGSTPTNTVTLTFATESSESTSIRKIFVGYESASGGGGGEKDYTVTAATSTGDNTLGTVSAGASSLDATETTTITASPATGYRVTNWAVSGTGASIDPSGDSNSNTTTLTMGSENATVTVTFGPKTYTITLDNQSATEAGTENVTATYNANTNLTSAITCPTKTDKVFAGYFTAANGGGVQLIDAAGNWIASAGGNNTYLDGSKNWKKDADVTLYACWMEYCPGMDIEAYVNENVTSGSPSQDFTILATNKFIYSLTTGSSKTELDNSTDATGQYDGLKIKASGDYVMFLVPANSSLSVKWGFVKSSKPKYSINGGAEQTFSTITTNADNSSSPGDIEISSQSYDQLVKIWATDGNATVLKKVTITAPTPVSCTDKYSFHYGPNEGDWETPICFEKVGETHEWNIANFTIPNHENGEFYVGYEGATYGQSATKAWTDDYSSNNGAMILLPTSGSKVGQAAGAKGTLVIWDDSGAANQYVGFKPNGYGISYGGSSHAFAATATANVLETDVVTLPDVSTNYTMGLATATEGTYVACAHSSAAEALNNIGVSILDGGKKKIYLDPGSFDAIDAEEKYAIYDNTATAFDTDFMTDADGDGVYEGYVSSTCASMILVRMSSEATTEELASKSWTHKWNQTGNIAISGTLAKKYTITSLNGDNCAYTEETVHPATGQKGKFRMYDNSGDQNWYVHFVPYYTLSYNANGGSNTMPATERSSESSTLTVTVAANAFTAPEGYTFDHWNTANDNSGENYAAAVDFTLTSDATLYAIWKLPAPTITCNSSTGSVTITAVDGATIKYSLDGSDPASGTTYNEAFTIDADKTVKAIAIKSGFANSDIASKNCVLCAEPAELTNEIARFFVPCNQATNAAWTTTEAVASSTGKNTFMVNSLGSTSDWSINATTGLIYGKFQSSSYVTMKLNNDKPFKIGDVVIAYFNSNDAKCNLKLHNSDGNALGDASASGLDGEYQRSKTLVAADIEEDGSLKFVRVNSSTYLNRIIVTREPAPKHHVTYALNGATGTTPEQDDVEEGESFTLHNGTTGITAPAGKAFASWSDGTNTYAGGDSYTMGTSDVTLTAQWEDKYTVTLIPAGGSCASYDGWTYDNVNDKYTKEVGSGAVVALPTFTKANRTFKTWRNAVPADVESPITVTANVTLTAVWNATLENVIYSWEGAEGGATEVGGTAAGKNNGSDQTGLINQVSGSYYCLKLDGKADYSTNYVEITLSGTEKVKTGDKFKVTAFYNKDSEKDESYKIVDSEGTLIKKSDYLVNINGGANSPRMDVFTVPAEINTSSVKLTRDPTATNAWITKLQIIRETLVEEANLCTVTFRYNDGATENTVVEVASGSKVAEPADPTWSHHRFNEWQLSGSAYDFSSTVTSNITLDATWTQLYTITYANGGGSGSAPTAVPDKAKDETFTVADNTFTAPTGKEFDKWNDGSADYNPGDTYTVGTTNVTLTAVWKDPVVKYAITKGSHTNGDFTISVDEQEAGETVTLTATPNEDYVFSAWEAYKTGDQTTTVTVTNNAFTMPAYGVTVNATFAADPRQKVLYVTSNSESDTKASDKVYAALKDTYNVKIVGPTSDADQSGYALVVLHESLNGGNDYNKTAVAAAKTGTTPVLNTKAYFYNSGRWAWGNPNAGKKTKGVHVNTSYCNITSHPLFNDLTPDANDSIIILSAINGDGKPIQPVGSFTSGKEGYTLANVPDGCAIHELTPAQRGASSGKYLLISLYSKDFGNLNANGQKLFQNAAAYLIGNTAWEPVNVLTSPAVAASPSVAYSVGDNIALTASATGSSATTTYTWYKGDTWAAAEEAGAIQAAATAASNGNKYGVTGCASGDAGTYWCVISNGTGCDAKASLEITVSDVSYDIAFVSAHGTAPTATTGVSYTLPELTASGWEHQGWTASIDVTVDAATVTAGTTIDNGKIAMFAADVTFTAVWAEIFDVTFNMQSHGASIAAQHIVDGGKATEPNDPSAIGWNFGGWFTDAACTEGNEFDFNTAITADRPLFAKWTAFDGCTELWPATSGDAPAAVGDAIVMQTGSNGASMTVEAKPDKLSYTTSGLQFGSESGVKVNVVLNNDLTVGTKISLTLVSGGTGGRGLHLYNAAGSAKIATLGWSSATNGEEKTFTYTVVAEDGLDDTNAFQLWRNNTVCLKSLKVESCGDAVIYHDLTSAITPDHDPAYATVTLSATSVREGRTATVTYSDIAEGMEFEAWEISGTGASIADASANPAVITMGTADAVVTLKVRTETPKHTVFYDMQGHGDAVDSEDVKEGKKVTEPVVAEVEGWIFGGWYKEAGCANAWDFDSDVMGTSNMTLYAKWTEDTSIRLIVSGAINSSKYYTGATMAEGTVTVDGVSRAYAKLGNTASDPKVNALNKVITYNATSTRTKVMVDVYNNATSARQVKIFGAVEGAGTYETLATIDLDNADKKHMKSAYYEFNNDKNRTIYISVPSSVGDVAFLQVKVIESGEALPMFGQIGYSIDFNKGRLVGPSSTDIVFEGMNYNLSSNYQALSGSNISLTKNKSYQFTVPVPTQITIDGSKAQYYVTTTVDGEENSTNQDGAHSFNLAAGTWYLRIGASNMSVKSISFTYPQVEIEGEMDDAALIAGADVVIPNGANLTLSEDHTLHNLDIEAGGKISVAENKTLTVNNLTINSEASKSGQLLGATNVTANAVYMDVTFFKGAETLDEETANRWYMISAPFDVNLADGFYKTDGTPMVFGQTDGENIFDLFEYDGNKRATTGVTGWKRVQGKMKAGRACLIGFNPGQPTTIRLKAASTVLSEPTSITLNAYDGDDANRNWNGVANPTLHYTDLSCDVQTYNNEDGENGRKYIAYSASNTSFVVGTAFFVQATGSIVLTAASHSEFRAPQRQANERYEACVRISRSEATEFADQMYVRASENASNEYEQGHDMITWNGTTANTALIWAENYGKRLAIEEAPLANDKATYNLGIFAPVAGTYRIEVANPNDDATLYLTKNGRIFWNLTMGACELDLAQGQNNEYGLLLRAEAPQVTTGMDEIHSEAGVQKIIIDENVFILRGEQLFDMTGKLVK